MNNQTLTCRRRFVNLLLGDIVFQAKYGFYFLYALVTLLYVLILRALPAQIALVAGAVLAFSDPSALGLFFMGAIVLLEKSERSINAVAVSPVRPAEYALSKALSLSLISTVSGLLIASAAGQRNLTDFIGIFAGLFAASVFFSFCGVWLAAFARSLNQFLLFAMPVMLFFMLPPIAQVFGFTLPLFRFHAGILLFRLIAGTPAAAVELSVLFVWIAAAAILARGSAAKLFKSPGGITL